MAVVEEWSVNALLLYTPLKWSCDTWFIVIYLFLFLNLVASLHSCHYVAILSINDDVTPSQFGFNSCYLHAWKEVKSCGAG